MATDKQEVDLKPGENKVVPLVVDDKNRGYPKEINLELKIDVKQKGGDKENGDNLSEISQAGENKGKPETDDEQKDGGAKEQGANEQNDGKSGEQNDEKLELGPQGQLAADKNQQKKLKNKGKGEEPKGQDDKKLENKEDENKEQENKESEEQKMGESKNKKNKKPELGPQGQLAAGRNKQKKSENNDKNEDKNKNQKFKTIQEWNKFKKQARGKNKRDKARGVKEEVTNKAIKLLSFEFYRQCWLHYFSSWTLTYFGLLFLFVLKYLKFEKNIISFLSPMDPLIKEKIIRGRDRTEIEWIMLFILLTFIEALIILIICVFIVIVYKALSNPAGTAITAVGLLIELGIKLLGLGS